jgi:hypothetical protein
MNVRHLAVVTAASLALAASVESDEFCPSEATSAARG